MNQMIFFDQGWRDTHFFFFFQFK